MKKLAEKTYLKCKVKKLSELSEGGIIQLISKELNINTYYFEDFSEANNLCDQYNIFLNKNQSEQKTWQDFGLYLGYILLQKQSDENCVILSINRHKKLAKKFMYHFCMPDFMMKNLNIPLINETTIKQLSVLFNVEYDFAKKRLTNCQ